MKIQYAVRWDSEVYHVVIDEAFWCKHINRRYCSIADEKPQGQRLCKDCASILKEMKVVGVKNQETLQELRGGDAFEEQYKHVSIFSLKAKKTDPRLLEWLKRYEIKEPGRFGAILFMADTGLHVAIQYQGSRRLYHVHLPTPDTKTYYSSPEWKEKRQEVFERDGSNCVFCGSPHNLVAHHRSYRNFGNEPLEDLTTLCNLCHKRFHRM